MLALAGLAGHRPPGSLRCRAGRRARMASCSSSVQAQSAGSAGDSLLQRQATVARQAGGDALAAIGVSRREIRGIGTASSKRGRDFAGSLSKPGRPACLWRGGGGPAPTSSDITGPVEAGSRRRRVGRPRVGPVSGQTEPGYRRAAPSAVPGM